jgi:hypothetical protein
MVADSALYTAPNIVGSEDIIAQSAEFHHDIHLLTTAIYC